MIPSPWIGLVLALAAYRVTRLIGWDDLPPIEELRAWVLGEYWETRLADTVAEPGYRRPLLAHLVHCPFCLGWWVSLAVYLAWLAWPTGCLYAAAPFALSGAVGLIARNLDP